MKIRVHRSKVTKKAYSRPVFPRLTKEESGSTTGERTVYKVDRQEGAYTAEAAAGYYHIRDFKRIKFSMKGEPDKFGKFLNKLVVTFADIVEDDGGSANKFSLNGTLFAFKSGSSPIDNIAKAINATLKMRYVLNKLNRDWGFIHGTDWKIGFGITYGPVQVKENTENYQKVAVVSGRNCNIAKGIGSSAGGSQIFLTDETVLKFPPLDVKYDLKTPKHVPVRGTDYLGKVREVVGMVGPQAKLLYKEFV